MQNHAMLSRNRRRAVAIVALLLVLAAAGYWWASPLLTIRAMQTAAQRGDADAFSEHVDYPRLRDSLKGQLAALAAARLGDEARRGHGLAAIGAAIGMSLAGGLIDTLVQPALVMRVMQEGKLLPRPDNESSTADGTTPAPKSPGDHGKPRIHWTTERQGVDTFLAHADRDPSSNGAASGRLTLVLHRSGFADWKLTEIRLPSPR